MESFSSTSYSIWDDDRAWSSQEWKAEATTHDRSGRPDKNSWRMVRKVRPDHEQFLLEGTAQSVRNGKTLRDRSGRLDNINSPEVARPQNSIVGNEETELVLSVESRSFVNRVNDQVRKRPKRISKFMAVTMESAVFIGKNYQNNCHSIANTTDLTLEQMFGLSTKIGVWDKMSSQDWKQIVGWIIHGNICR